MKKALLSTILVFSLLASTSATSSWTVVSDRVEDSIVFVEILAGTEVQGSCTGFVIDETKKHVLTAAHCDGEKILADGTPTYKVYKDERKDLLVLRASGIDRPALKLAAKNPERGEEVASMGYGFGLEQPMFRIAHVDHAKREIESLSGPFVSIDAGFIGGQSGGPVVNLAGEVVSIVQRGSDSFGFGVGAETIKDRVGRYFSN